jgi:hypothetical protein
VAAVAPVLAATPPDDTASGERGRLEAPLPLRGQFPLSLPFIDLVPESAFIAAHGTLRWHIDLSYLSTHATSDAMLERFATESTRPADGRVTEQVLVDTAATAPSGHAYYVDGETARMTLGLAWGLGGRVTLEATLPLLAHGGGFLDPSINQFHDWFNLPDGGRPDFANDQYVIGLTDDGTTLFRGEAPSGLGVGDLALETRVALARPAGDRFALAGVGTVELPTGGTGRLDGNGSLDAAAGLEATWRAKRSTWHVGGAYAFIGRFDPAPDLAPRDRVAAYASTAILLQSRNSVLLGLHAVTGPFGREHGGSLGRMSFETSFGFRHLTTDGGLFEAAFLENLTADHNVPDVGFYLGWGFSPH